MDVLNQEARRPSIAPFADYSSLIKNASKDKISTFQATPFVPAKDGRQQEQQREIQAEESTASIGKGPAGQDLQDFGALSKSPVTRAQSIHVLKTRAPFSSHMPRPGHTEGAMAGIEHPDSTSSPSSPVGRIPAASSKEDQAAHPEKWAHLPPRQGSWKPSLHAPSPLSSMPSAADKFPASGALAARTSDMDMPPHEPPKLARKPSGILRSPSARDVHFAPLSGSTYSASFLARTRSASPGQQTVRIELPATNTLHKA